MPHVTRNGPVPRGFRAGAALGPTTTALAGLYAERVEIFNSMIDGDVDPASEEFRRRSEAVFALDLRILEAPLSRLADLGVKARILRYLAAGLGDADAPAVRAGFESLVSSFLVEVETSLGSPVEKAAGIAGH